MSKRTVERARRLLYRRIATPCMLALLGLLICVPVVGAQARSVVGPKHYYLALGDSLAFGFQPDLDFTHGYANDLYTHLQTLGTSARANLACPGESSVTFINGDCPAPVLRKYPYIGAQLSAALAYLHFHAGQVSPVTLDIGANDVINDINRKTCAIDTTKFNADLTTLDANLRQIILPELHDALTVNGVTTGDLVVMNVYDPFQITCPQSVSFAETLDVHLAQDIAGYALLADAYTAFGSDTATKATVCSETWICSIFKDIHATDKGYTKLAGAFEQALGY